MTLSAFPALPALPALRRLGNALLASLALLAANAEAADPRGRWITASGNLEVEIEPCGAALCGVVTAVLANRSMTGSAAPGPADRRSPIGLKIMTDFVATDFDASVNQPAEWAGALYNRENGKSYPCRMTLDGDHLVLRAQVSTLMDITQRWQRAGAAAGAQ